MGKFLRIFSTDRFIRIFIIYTAFLLIGGGSETEIFCQSTLDERSLNENWRWVQFTIESGLPSNQIISIEETKDGTVWVATTRGVAWYDGFRWNLVDSMMGLPIQQPRSLKIGNDGDVYLLLEDGQLFRGNKRGFKRILSSFIHIERIAILDSSRLIFSTKEKMLVDSSTQVSSLIFPEIDRYIHDTKDIIQTKAGIWLNTNYGLFKYSGGKWEKIIRSQSGKLLINSIQETNSSSGLISVGLPFKDRGLWEWKNNGQVKKNSYFRADWITTMDLNQFGDVVAVEKTGEVLLRKGSQWSRLSVIPNQMRDVELLKFRSNGDLWVGTKRGLYLFRQYSMYWEHKQNRFYSRNRIHDIIRSIDGTLWLATADGLEKHYPDGSKEIITHIKNNPLYEVTSIAEDKNGKIWIGSGSAFDGAYFWDGAEWNYRSIDSSLKWLKIHRIKKDRLGNLWFLGLSESVTTDGISSPGAFKYDGEKFTRWSVSNGLISGRVYAFCEDNKGGYWFGTQHGLTLFYRGSWKSWMCPSDIPFSKIFTMAVDLKNNVWFSDRTTGLGCLDENGSIKYYKIEDGLPSNNIWEIKIDSKGGIWVTSEGGLGYFNGVRWKIYDIRTGLLTNDLWPIYLEGDSVFVGTKGKGLAILNLRRCHQPTPKIFIEKPLVEDDRAYIKIRPFTFWGEIDPREILIRYSFDSACWSPWSYKRELIFDKLKPGMHSIKFQAQNLFNEYNLNPSEVSFEIQPPLYLRSIFIFPISLLLFTSFVLSIIIIVRRIRQNQLLQRSEAKFKHLADATIEGVVLHSNGLIEEANNSMTKIFGYSDEELSKKSFFDLFPLENREIVRDKIADVRMGYFQTIGLKKSGEKIWLEVISMLLPGSKVGISVAAIRDITERKGNEEKLIKYQQQLRKLVSELVFTEERERRKMAEYLHDNIGQTLAYCKIKLFSMKRKNKTNLQDTTLVEVHQIIDEVITNTRSLTYDLSSPVLYELGLFSAVESLAEQTGKRHDLKVSVINNNSNLKFNIAESIIIYQSVRELLSNTVKHAHAHKIKIDITVGDKNLEIHYYDDGIGFDPDKIIGKGGFGLFNIKEKLKDIGAELRVNSNQLNGVNIIISVPLENEIIEKL